MNDSKFARWLLRHYAEEGDREAEGRPSKTPPTKDGTSDPSAEASCPFAAILASFLYRSPRRKPGSEQA